MPVTFRPSDVLSLNRYGTFTKFRLPGQTILAASAVNLATIAAATADDRGVPFQKPFDPTLANIHTVGIPSGWAVIIERFNWGGTSRPDEVYYEIHNWGATVSPQAQEGFHCGGPIGQADVDNRSTHPSASERLDLKVWNCTGGAPVDVWYEFAVWYYMFDLKYLGEITALSFDALFDRQNEKLEEIVRQLKEMNQLLKEVTWPRIVQLEERR